ncbi:MAG: hypothetical protein AAGF48_16010 [Pseudomonadota bacterium]
MSASKKLRKWAGWAKGRAIALERNRRSGMRRRAHATINQGVSKMRQMERDLMALAEEIDRDEAP